MIISFVDEGCMFEENIIKTHWNESEVKRDVKEYWWWTFRPALNKMTGPAYAGSLAAAIQMLELKMQNNTQTNSVWILVTIQK